MDGRRTRWETHRAERRAQLVEAGLSVLGEVGVDFGLDQVAERAGVTRPVIYRHFTDRAGLVEAMGSRAMADLLDDHLMPALATTDPPITRVRRTIDAFLAHVEENPNVYWLFAAPAAVSGDGTTTRTKEIVAAALATLLGDFLRSGEGDVGVAEVWAHGLVGLVQNTTEWWLERHTMTRDSLATYLTTLVWAQIDGLARRHGVVLDPHAPLSPSDLAPLVARDDDGVAPSAC